MVAEGDGAGANELVEECWKRRELARQTREYMYGGALEGLQEQTQNVFTRRWEKKLNATLFFRGRGGRFPKEK